MYIEQQDFKRDEKGGRDLYESLYILERMGEASVREKWIGPSNRSWKRQTCFSTKLNFVLSSFIQAHVRIDYMKV